MKCSGLIWPQLLCCWDSSILFLMHYSFIAALHQNIDDGQFGVHSKLDKKQKLTTNTKSITKTLSTLITFCTFTVWNWIPYKAHCITSSVLYSRGFELIHYHGTVSLGRLSRYTLSSDASCLCPPFLQMGWIVSTLAGWRARQRFACVCTTLRCLQCPSPRRNSRSLASGRDDGKVEFNTTQRKFYLKGSWDGWADHYSATITWPVT